MICDNNGVRTNVISGLKKGDKLVAKKSTIGTGDIGASGLCFKYNSFIVDKIYTVDHTYYWDGVIVSYVIDEDGTSQWVTPDIFDLLE